jgi:hypothetical protein
MEYGSPLVEKVGGFIGGKEGSLSMSFCVIIIVLLIAALVYVKMYKKSYMSLGINYNPYRVRLREEKRKEGDRHLNYKKLYEM